MDAKPQSRLTQTIAEIIIYPRRLREGIRQIRKVFSNTWCLLSIITRPISLYIYKKKGVLSLRKLQILAGGEGKPNKTNPPNLLQFLSRITIIFWWGEGGEALTGRRGRKKKGNWGDDVSAVSLYTRGELNADEFWSIGPPTRNEVANSSFFFFFLLQHERNHCFY